MLKCFTSNLFQVTEDAANGKSPPMYHYAVPEATSDEAATSDNDENSNSGPRVAAVGGGE